MTAKFAISNRQRTIDMDLDYVQEMADKLGAAVFNDLLSRPAEHLPKSLVAQVEKRGEFSLVLVSNRQIRKLNKEWMGKDRPTDVLSFPLELEPPVAVQLPWEVGEIVISVEKIEEQAQEYAHSFERELAFLFVHGLLHVLGFDHIEPDEEKDMFGRQRRILNRCGFKR